MRCSCPTTHVLPCARCAVLLEKFKDKAAVVNRAATEALQSMARYSFGLSDVAEDIAAALAHQNPKVKESTLAWLTGCVARETKQGVSKLMPLVVPAAAKCTDEGAPTIREAAFGFLVQATLKVGCMLNGAAVSSQSVLELVAVGSFHACMCANSIRKAVKADSAHVLSYAISAWSHTTHLSALPL